MVLYYFDTSIWLDLFEERDEPNFPKSKYAHELIESIIRKNDRVIYSNIVIRELVSKGYSRFEVSDRLFKLQPILVYLRASEQQLRRAKDIAQKRKVPLGDAIHALVARDSRAILVTFDRDFQKLLDIVNAKNPKELI